MTKPRRTETDTDRSEQILAAATELFAERGYSLTSLMDIAHTLDITGPAIYHWFDRKDEILFQIMERTIARAIGVTNEIIGSHPDPIAALARIAEAHVGRVIVNVAENSVYRRERVHLSPRDDETIRRHEREYESLLYDVYRRGVDDRRLVPVDPRIGIGTFLGACRWAFRANGSIPDDTLGPTVARLAMRCIVAALDDPVFGSLTDAST